jgi:hypothetical protein
MCERILVLDIDKLVVCKGTQFPHTDTLQAGRVDSTSLFYFIHLYALLLS